MTDDELKESIVFRLSKKIDSFWDFSEDLIVDPKIEISKIKKILEKIYVELRWSDEGDGIYFGFVPCKLSNKVGHRFFVEIWLHRNPFCIFIDGGYAIDVKEIAKNLNMVAFDILCGNRIYP